MGYDTKDICIYLVLPVLVLVSIVIIIIWSVPGSDFIAIGDEVETTEEYSTIFNDSFTGHVISARNGVYLVRCDNGTEREFVSKWIDRCIVEEI